MERLFAGNTLTMHVKIAQKLRGFSLEQMIFLDY